MVITIKQDAHEVTGHSVSQKSINIKFTVLYQSINNDVSKNASLNFSSFE